jgi:hypothetical protein
MEARQKPVPKAKWTWHHRGGWKGSCSCKFDILIQEGREVRRQTNVTI